MRRHGRHQDRGAGRSRGAERDQREAGPRGARAREAAGGGLPAAGGARAEPLVVLLEQRGRFLVGEPVFGPGRRVTVERGKDAQPGRLALLRAARGGAGRARVERVIGRPDVARDALEAYMLHRGLHRRFAAGVERAARDATDRPFEAPAPRGPPPPPTLTLHPGPPPGLAAAISAPAL